MQSSFSGQRQLFWVTSENISLDVAILSTIYLVSNKCVKKIWNSWLLQFDVAAGPQSTEERCLSWYWSCLHHLTHHSAIVLLKVNFGFSHAFLFCCLDGPLCVVKAAIAAESDDQYALQTVLWPGFVTPEMWGETVKAEKEAAWPPLVGQAGLLLPPCTVPRDCLEREEERESERESAATGCRRDWARVAGQLVGKASWKPGRRGSTLVLLQTRPRCIVNSKDNLGLFLGMGRVANWDWAGNGKLSL